MSIVADATDIPVLKIGNVLLVSIHTEITDQVAAELQKAILQNIRKSRAAALVIDTSGLGLVDSYIGRVLNETARMAQLMDTDVCLAGMQPAVAITMAEMGLGFPEVKVAASLDLAFQTLGYRLERFRADRASREEDDSPSPPIEIPVDAQN